MLLFPGIAMFALGLGAGPLVGDESVMALYDIASTMPVVGAALGGDDGLVPMGAFFLIVGAAKVLAVLAMWGWFGPALDTLANALLIAMPAGAAYIHPRMTPPLSVGAPAGMVAVLLLRLVATRPRTKAPRQEWHFDEKNA